MAKGLPLENLLTETDTPYFPKKEVFEEMVSYWLLLPSTQNNLSPFYQYNNLSIGVPGLALEYAKEIAAIRGEDLSVVLTAVRNNARDLYNID